MSVAAAILIVGALYFIDKHNRWKQALRFGVMTAVLASLLLAYGYVSNSRRLKAEERTKAEQVAAKKQIEKACSTAGDVFDQVACEDSTKTSTKVIAK